MKNILIISLALLLGACSAVDKTVVEINPRPTLTLGYRYINGQGQNTTAKEVAWLDIFLFDPAGRLLKTLHAEADQILSSAGLPLLDGVPAGEYTVVSYANVEQGAFSAMTPGVSTPTELRLTLTKGAEYATCDALFHGMGRFLVKRGEARITTVALDKLFYRLDLSVTGAEQVEDFRVTFCGAPSGIDYAGAAVNEPVTYCPPLQHTGEGVLGGTLRIPRFADSHAVTMTLLSGERLLAQMALSEYLAQNGNHIDLTAKDVVIPIDIMVNTSDVTVTVNDWDEGAVQLPIVGH